ncbi:MAG: NAD(P) transhydrogenase subunit alpha [Nitrospiria bacterium]
MLIFSVTLFVLAAFLGYELTSKAPTLLHTPLLSAVNAISGITVVGSVLVAGTGEAGLGRMLGLFAVIFATANVVGGFMLTRQTLKISPKKPG